MASNVFGHYREQGKPALKMSGVLYLDVLGTTAAALQEEAEAADHIVRLSAALDQARAMAGEDHGWSHATAYFSDSIAVSAPLMKLHPEVITSQLVYRAGALQWMLVAHGFVVRGGMTIGLHYTDERMAFGDAITRAVKIEETPGGVPRIVLSEEFVAQELKSVEAYADPHASPQAKTLLVDEEGVYYVNYLNVVIVNADDDDEAKKAVLEHRSGLLRAWAELKKAPDCDPDGKARDKLAWVTRYHNWICDSYELDSAKFGIDAAAVVEGAEVTPGDREFVPFGADLEPYPETGLEL